MKNVFAPTQSNRVLSNFPGGHGEEDGAEIKSDGDGVLRC